MIIDYQKIDQSAVFSSAVISTMQRKWIIVFFFTGGLATLYLIIVYNEWEIFAIKSVNYGHRYAFNFNENNPIKANGSYESSRVALQLPNEENTSTEHGSAIKTILYWNKMYVEQEKYFFFGHGDIFKGCPVPHCYATNKRDYHESLTDFDAILFHGVEMVKGDIPKVRSPNQRYVFFTWESAASRPINNHVFELTPNYYNWTMGFRMDSDIPRPYAVVRDRNTNEIVAPSSKEVSWREPEDTFSDPELDNLVKEKTKMAAWFVSHCNTISKRDALVAALRKYIRVYRNFKRLTFTVHVGVINVTKIKTVMGCLRKNTIFIYHLKIHCASITSRKSFMKY
ncbi:alpha-(1,3)-fucosyltransferase fut-1-like [Cephus cinctus]|uniref:Fucosyltransferase n=1 Tax=Cephus cinctus TaxID=211228 RepID=A0AAJ7VZZ8_CEPCN|nr:alpha-(1,3)-fucosyltransferase fut-1-like [Cephus cinctus]